MNVLFSDRRVLRGLSENRVAYCFRKDVEKTEMKRPFGNFDLSHRTPIDRKMRTRSEVVYGCREFMNYLGEFDKIETNRLHVAAGGALLGKEVALYPNSYWKNQAVFEASLRDRFKNLSWADPLSDNRGDKPESSEFQGDE